MTFEPAYVGAGLTAVIAAGAFAVYIIRGEIARGPKGAQPRNGGTGWSDVHVKLDTVLTRQLEVVEDVRYLRERVDRHIDTHDHHNPTPYRRRQTDPEG